MLLKTRLYLSSFKKTSRVLVEVWGIFALFSLPIGLAIAYLFPNIAIYGVLSDKTYLRVKEILDQLPSFSYVINNKIYHYL